MGVSDFRVPREDASEDRKGGWLKECCQEGQQYVRQQKAYKSVPDARDRILSNPMDDLPSDMSNVKIPQAKRQIRELVSIMANLKPTASNKTDNPELYPAAEMFNLLDRNWWFNTFFDRKTRTAYQTAALEGTAYLSHIWDPDYHDYGRGDIRTDVYGPDDVLLIQPPRDFDLQRCYAVIIVSRVPLWIVHAQFPTRAHQITADIGTNAYTNQGLEYVQSFVSSPIRALAGPTAADRNANDIFPKVTIYDTYITDLSVNMTGKPIRMGEASWVYDVPAFNSDIPTGLNSWEGVPNMRKASRIDAMLYPFKRRMIGTGTGLILSDGSSPWSHGKVPAAKVTFDDWPGEPLGFPLTRDVATIEDDANRLCRGISDSAIVRLNPAVAIDENLVSERLAERLNFRQPGQRIRMNMSMGEAIKTIVPADYLNQPTWIPEWAKNLFDREGYIMGVSDMMALAKAKQVPSSDTIDKLLQMAGPLAEDMTRNQEFTMRELGDQRRYLNLQFRPTRRAMEILGDDGLPESQVFDWDPAALVPSHMPGEQQEQPSKYSFIQRAKKTAQQFEYRVVANSMARRQQLTYRLTLIQLAKMVGLPIDPWTWGELFEIDNFGQPPEGTTSIMQRWVAWQRMLSELGGGQQQGQQRGRPSSGKGTPRVRSKDNSTRSTIANA